MTIPEALGDQIKSPCQVWDILRVAKEASATPKQHRLLRVVLTSHQTYIVNLDCTHLGSKTKRNQAETELEVPSLHSRLHRTRRGCGVGS